MRDGAQLCPCPCTKTESAAALGTSEVCHVLRAKVLSRLPVHRASCGVSGLQCPPALVLLGKASIQPALEEVGSNEPLFQACGGCRTVSTSSRAAGGWEGCVPHASPGCHSFPSSELMFRLPGRGLSCRAGQWGWTPALPLPGAGPALGPCRRSIRMLGGTKPGCSSEV